MHLAIPETLRHGYDYESLSRDTTKFIVMDVVPKISKLERSKLLRVMLECFSRYFGDDYSVLLNECADKIESHKIPQETGEDLPFV